MPNHLRSYLNIVAGESPGAVESIKETVDQLIPEHVETFTHKEHVKGLLLGQVQSGKTGQMLGVIAAAADADEAFSVFVLLTSDMTGLQQQTYKRALAAMDTFNVCDEHDEMRFLEIGKRKPSLIVLKKNSSILKKWLATINQSNFLQGRPIFIVDDEADAASLNTQVNKAQSTSTLTQSSGYLQAVFTCKLPPRLNRCFCKPKSPAGSLVLSTISLRAKAILEASSFTASRNRLPAGTPPTTSWASCLTQRTRRTA